MREVIFSGDNGLVAFLVVMIIVVWAYVKQNRKYYIRRLRKMYLKIEKRKKYRRYCKFHRREIIAMMERRERIEGENRKKSVLGIY